MAAFIVWTLVPFELRALDPSALFAVAVDDVAGNLLVAVPIGWLLAAVVGAPRATAAMFVLSLGVEVAQLFVVTRSPALSDVLANTTGAAAGALWWRRRPHPLAMANAMLVAVACWGIAARHAAPGRPLLTVGILLALAMATVREAPAQSPDAAGFALVAASGFIGLSPVGLVFAALGAAALGAAVPGTLRAWRGPMAALVPVAFLVETWPPFRIATGRVADPPLMVVEATLIGLATLLLVLSPRGDRSARAGS